MNAVPGRGSAVCPQRPAESGVARELTEVRPSLRDAYAAALPEARSAVLQRLWRALLYERLPGVAARDVPAGRVVLCDGRTVQGPVRLPHDLATPTPGRYVRLDGHAHSHPAALLTALGLPGAAQLTGELDDSVASLALSLASAASPPPDGPRDDRSLADAEQSVVDGHPYHPCCRSRPGFSVAEQLAYAPEHRTVVGLDLVAVPARRLLVVGDWPARLRAGDRLLLPVHPWQTRHVLPALGYEPFVRDAVRARPLLSVRTLAPLDGGPHLKTALSLRLTSQVRDISPAGVTNSGALSALVDDLMARTGGLLTLTRNLAAASAVVNGAPSSDLAVLVRESPAAAGRTGPGDRVVPVAALAARPPGGGPPLVRSLLAAAGGPGPAVWLGAFAKLVLPPALRLLSLGVALEAHGQNLLVVLDAHARPLRAVYRDVADVRVSPARLARHGVGAPALAGPVLSDDPAVLRRHLFGSLVGGTFAGLVSALGEGDRDREDRLWREVARVAHGVPEGSAADTARADRAALLGGTFPVKALTAMRFSGTHGGDLWTDVPNPLARR
jgi:siderophore synthetase component